MDRKQTDRKRERKPIFMLRIAAVLLVMTLISVYGAGNAVAKYISSDYAQEQARVASFVLRVNKNETSSTPLRLDGITKPGDSASYAFTVTNAHAAGQLSEVNEIYTLTVRVNGDLPLTFTLDRPAGDDLTQTLDLLAHDMADNTADENRSFTAAVQAGREYTLTATWPATANDWVYASDAAAAYCLLTVTGEQTD